MNLLELVGLDLDSQAKGEINALNNRRTRFESYDLGDRIRGALTGVSREQLEKRLRDRGPTTDRRIPTSSRHQCTKSSTLTADFQGVKGKTEGEIEAA